jgi:predicted dehydrogenase
MKLQDTIGRRVFIKSVSAAVFSAPWIVPSTVIGANAPSNRLTMGCIGVGGMGTQNLEKFLGRTDVQVLAVCDVDTSHRLKAKELVEKKYAENQPSGSYRGCDNYNDFRDIISRADIDLVSIATPDHWHAITAIAASDAGKGIYCEKPLALTIKQGRAICDAVRRNGTTWQTGSWQRSVDNFRVACELVRNGRIGTLQNIYIGLPLWDLIGLQPEMPVPEGFDYNFWLGPAPWAPYTEKRCHFNFRWILDYAGGIITDWGAHHIDIAQWGMGTDYTGPVEIEGKGEFPREGISTVARTFHVTCKYSSGVILEIATTDKFNQGIKFVGTDGWVFVSREEFDTEPKSLPTTVIGRDEIHLYRSNDHWGNFIDCAHSHGETITPPEIAHRSITIAHLGNIAMLLERKIQWDPEHECCIRDPETNRMLDSSMRSPWHLE